MAKKAKAEIREFVEKLAERGYRDKEWMEEGPNTPMCVKEAYDMIDRLKAEQIAFPEAMTAYQLATAWDAMIGG